jgi:hypothetical protein
MSWARIGVNRLLNKLSGRTAHKSVSRRERVESLELEPTPDNFNQGSDLSSIDFDHHQVTIDGE